MANNIKRKQLYARLGDIRKTDDWARAAVKLGLDLGERNGTSHYLTIRDPQNKNHADVRSLVQTVQHNLYKEANQQIFKGLLRFGLEKGLYEEDNIWRALKMLK